MRSGNFFTPKAKDTEMKRKLIGRLIILGVFSCCCQVFGQEKVNVTAGIGCPELLNFGVRYQLSQAQIGVSYGSVPSTGAEGLFSISSDVYYHFGGMTKLSERRPWYARAGLNYVRSESAALIEKDLFLDFRIGRDLNISKKVGVEIDAGPLFWLLKKETRKEPPGWLDFDIYIPLLPSIGIAVFYRM